MIRLTITTAAAVALSAAALANGGPVKEPLEPIDPEPIIERCWSLSGEDRASGVTARMREGMWTTADCLKERIVEHGVLLIDPEAMGEDEIRKDLDELAAPYTRLQWSIYNDRRGCYPLCGTMYHSFSASATAHLYEDILRDIIGQINFDREH